MAAPWRALLIEDLEILRAFLDTVLRAAGFEVVLATVRDSPYAAGAENFDLVCLPGTEGLDLLRVIRKLSPGCKVLVLSGDPGYEPLALAAGADAFLLKGGQQNFVAELHALIERLGFRSGGDTRATP
jgi:DNA-binding response OmpR family regulator